MATLYDIQTKNGTCIFYKPIGNQKVFNNLNILSNRADR